MTLYHVTRARSLGSILRSGLRVTGSHEGRPVVWLCDGEHLLWTLHHVARWKGRAPSSMRVLSVECEPGALTLVRPGTYLSWGDIPPDRIECRRSQTGILLDPIIRFILSRMEHGDAPAEATERARRHDRFAGVPPDVFAQAARLARHLS
jgi:hypothetical protein